MSGAVELTIIVPVKDEEDGIAPFVATVVPVLEAIKDPVARSFEILFIDDGSTDRTLERVRDANAADPRVRCVSFSRNFGKESALSAGLDEARGAAVIPLDVDLQDPPEVIGEMVKRWREGNDVVYGVRDNRESDSLPKRMTADLYYRAHNWMSSDKIPEHAGDFRLLDRKVIEVIRRMPERNRFMKGLFAWAGFKQTSVGYHRVERAVGTTKFNYWKLWTLAIDGLTSASTAPLRIWSYLGGFVALFALAYAIFIIIRTIFFGIEVPGYASMMTAILFLGGLQLISLGVLGEYVGRILIETKGRPIYVVRERIGEP
ncbi:glycosyltransferase family 2 protein [Sphingomonas rhizophila]|uniref:Glycosyltransferase family 2 protein n=1 Tax=Sphingomonas rhizophila TaxID=2071607 RepID=A0A7G9SAB6_9SPHN|nr:glycosyltransferase family 2 protein [Sphingomonas rhizophila]QNN64791.1 glycosyltransferase family 2 protein [Sphingomonas rhizophila]